MGCNLDFYEMDLEQPTIKKFFSRIFEKHLTNSKTASRATE